MTVPLGNSIGRALSEKDPDRRVQDAVLLVFTKFMELGTARQVLLWFIEHGLRLPVVGRRGEVHWVRPSYGAVHQYGRERTGTAKDGPALLAGILRCWRCGRKLMVRYAGNHHDVLRYVCYRGWLDNGEPPCVGFGGLLVDEAIAKEILRVVQPAAVAAAVLATIR